MSTIKERVAAGAALLDERMPGWEQDVNPHTLDLSSPCHCVLGQIFGLYDHGVETMAQIPQFEAEDQGFWTSSDSEYDELTSAWYLLIRERRATASTSTGESEGA